MCTCIRCNCDECNKMACCWHSRSNPSKYQQSVQQLSLIQDAQIHSCFCFVWNCTLIFAHTISFLSQSDRSRRFFLLVGCRISSNAQNVTASLSGLRMCSSIAAPSCSCSSRVMFAFLGASVLLRLNRREFLCMILLISTVSNFIQFLRDLSDATVVYCLLFGHYYYP